MPSHPNYFDLLCKMNVWNWLVWSGEWNIGRGKKLKKTKKTTTLLWCLRRRRHRRRRNRYRRSACHLVSREILKKTFFVSVIVLCLIIYIVFKTTVLWHVEEQAVCWVSSVSVMFSNAFELAPPPSTSRVCTSLCLVVNFAMVSPLIGRRKTKRMVVHFLWVNESSTAVRNRQEKNMNR